MLTNDIALISLSDIGCNQELAETQPTIEGNSIQKAQFVFDNYHVNVFADDTGLEVSALNNEPGVKSARYAGEQRDNEANIDLLLTNLQNKTDRSARFKTVITLILEGQTHQFEGIVNGQIGVERKGDGGFGYDAIFYPNGYDITFAQMSLDQKNQISHRALAVKKLVDYLNNHI